MGQRQDQSLPGETTYRPSPASEIAASPPPYAPPLPPRESGRLSPRYSQQPGRSWTHHDPRNASTESLVPANTEHGKRTLLLIYIHGFMGNETSFQSFPAHVHNVVTQKLVETHVVHTKVYPRYKSRRAIDFARDDFSNW